MADSAEDPEARLIGAVAGGDDDAFGTLYRSHLPIVLRWLLRQSGNREVAADLAAEVFAAALISAGSYRADSGSVAAWLLGIARNKLLESLRHQRVEDSARRRLGLEPAALTDADLERVEELASVEAEFAALLDRLPADQRNALTGRVIDERPYSQLAEQLQCSELVVRQRVSRALKTLRSQVEER
jgi:RNA polymerase sigma factor (sigma-70 family)